MKRPQIAQNDSVSHLAIFCRNIAVNNAVCHSKRCVDSIVWHDNFVCGINMQYRWSTSDRSLRNYSFWFDLYEQAINLMISGHNYSNDVCVRFVAAATTSNNGQWSRTVFIKRVWISLTCSICPSLYSRHPANRYYNVYSWADCNMAQPPSTIYHWLFKLSTDSIYSEEEREKNRNTSF